MSDSFYIRRRPHGTDWEVIAPNAPSEPFRTRDEALQWARARRRLRGGTVYVWDSHGNLIQDTGLPEKA